MKTAPRILLLTLALATWATAELPKKAPLTKYTGLWTNSPFTSKPPPPTPVDTVNPLEDYALAGVSPISSGYRVTMLNKKKPEERITVDSDSQKSDYKILEVTRKPGDPLGTVVRMQAGLVTGTVSFDEKLLVLATPKAPPKAPPGAPGAPGTPVTNMPGSVPGAPAANMPGGAPGSSRMPRPRVVPPSPAAPAAPAAAPISNQSSQSGQRPTRRGSYGR